MDFVSFETALKLKEAGFPQPEMEFGQMWYSVSGEPVMCAGFEDEYTWNFIKEGFSVFKETPACFAPTVSDVLRHSSAEKQRKIVSDFLNQKGYDIQFDKDGFWMEDQRWGDHKTKDIIDLIVEFSLQIEFPLSLIEEINEEEAPKTP